MNRLSQTILPLALSIGLVGGLDVSAIASPRYSQYNRSGVTIVSPSRHRHNNYYDNYRRGRRIDYGRRRSRRYSSYDCDRGYRRVGRRNRKYYSGQRVIINPPIYRDSPSNSGYIRIIRY